MTECLTLKLTIAPEWVATEEADFEPDAHIAYFAQTVVELLEEHTVYNAKYCKCNQSHKLWVMFQLTNVGQKNIDSLREQIADLAGLAGINTEAT